ncbi:MAG TPA: asparagine synthase-related protein [Gemmatimonadaceae bacterium]|nr:asparagine synthase-related protein [Gemmatimonadaceae bacterium]
MSGFFAVIDPSRRLLAEPGLVRPMAALSSRGDRFAVWRNNESVMVVSRFDWELADEFSGPGLIVHDADVTVAADATLYYRDDLLRALSGANVKPAGRTPAHLIAAAYRAWGTDCTRHLEGDYAFVVRDHARHRTFAARDFMGRRPLYYAEIGTGLILSSQVSAIVAHPACSRELDDVALAEIVGYSLAGHERTPYVAVRALPAAQALVRDGSGAVRVTKHWTIVVDDRDSAESFDAASEELRDLLGNAIVERRAVSGPTTIWLSGGYDSPVMFGVGNAALDRLGYDRLAPVSCSYPPGDPGREDELIEEITAFWSTRPTWVSIDDIPMLTNVREHAARADIPFQHAFENWLRALLGATAREGSRVVLYGDGGDQLFAVSTVFLRDLFSNGRWRELRREWRAFDGSGVRELWHQVARPELAARVRRARGRTTPGIGLPTWLDAGFVARHSLVERQAAAESELEAGGHASAETRRSLGNPTIPRVLAGLSAMALEHGIELRAPLLDQRVVRFALRRPRRERASAGAVKHLLRRSASTLLPASVLAPRVGKTGVLTGYFARSFRGDPGGVVTDAFSQSILADRGIVDGAAMQHAWREYKGAGGGGGAYLFVAFMTEMWLRARDVTAVASTDAHASRINVPAVGFVQ